MNNRIVVILPFMLSLLIYSCRERVSVSYDQFRLAENDSVYLEKLPGAIYLYDDSTIMFLNSNKSIMKYSTKGRFINELEPDFDFSGFLKLYNQDKFGDSSINYDPNLVDNNFLRLYPKYTLYAMDHNDSFIYVFYDLSNPIEINGNKTFDFISFILKCDPDLDRIIDTFYVGNNYYEDFGFGISPEYSYIQKDDSIYYIAATYHERKVCREVALVKKKLKKNIYQMTKSYHFPFPITLITRDTVKEFKYPFLIPVCLVKNQGKLYFANATGIYDLESGDELFSLKDIYHDDSIRAIMSFDLIKNGKALNFLMVEATLPKEADFDKSDKYLTILSSDRKKVLYKRHLGTKVSWIKVIENEVYLLKETNEAVYLLKFDLKF